MKTLFPNHPNLLRIGLALSLGLTAVRAQTVVPATATTPGVRIQVGPGVPTVVSPDKPADPADPGQPQPAKEGAAPPAPQPLGQALRSMNFDRSAEAVLNATRSQRKTGTLSPAEEFRMSVMFGDWAAVGKALAALPPEEAVAGYTRMLDALSEQSIPVGDVLKTQAPDNSDPYERMNRMREEQQQQKKKPAPFLSEDFYSLVEAAPADLKEDNIPALTKLVKTALGEGGKSTLVAKLQKGWKGLGGESAEGRKLATRLLSSLGWIKDAAPFLPLKNEEWEGADVTQLVFAMEYFTQAGIADHDERQLQKAAELCAWLMKTSRFGNYARPQFRLAMDRLVQLLPVLDAAEAQKLIREHLFKQTATLTDLISVIGEIGQTTAAGQDLKARAASLGTQHLILEALVPMTEPLPENVAVFVLNWLSEAEGCYRAGGAVAVEMTQTERIMMQRYGYGRQQEVNTLGTDKILETAPPKELLPRLNPGLAQRVELTLLKVNILQPKETNLDLLREYVKAHPGLEKDVCQDVLTGWVSKRTKPSESEQVKQMRAMGMYVPPQMQQGGSGIPLTRLRQNQNIQQFKDLLGQLRQISPQALDPALIVQCFMTLHSGAEVYRLADIEAIFGPPEKMNRAELLSLLDGMRGRLAEQWRDPKTQQQAGTNRTEQEAKDEVSRGYRTALELAKRGIKAEDGDWESFITRGQLFFDASQYEFDRQIKLSDYVDLRDEAFGSFRKSAEIYAAKIPSMPRGQWTIEPYASWFYIMLGASDLAQLTTNTARTDPGLQGIGDAMRALPGEASAKHLEMFAQMLGEVFPRVPANVRQRFLHSGLKIIGENHPAAASAMKSLNYYRELLDEVQLRLTVDGPTRVGHSQPFGAFLSLEATRQLMRESGGFGKYLQDQGKQQAMMMGQPGGGRNLREDFAKNIHAALDETFEILSLTFHEAGVKTIDLPREGWVETPLVYAVLRAKNAAVDRIPSIQIDMDFVDQPGQVVLPVMSQVQPLDAKDDAVEPRPCGDLGLTLTMDEREWRDGKVVVEILARAQGVIPKIDEMFDYTPDGFDLEKVDGNLSVTQFVSDSKKRVPHADRNWQLTYRRKADLRGDVVFHFPKLKDGIKLATIEHKHYQDADLIAVDEKTAAAGVKLTNQTSSGLQIAAVLGGLLAVIIAVVVFLRRKKASAHVGEEDLVVPENPTPFTTISFLRRVGRLHGSHLSPADQSALQSEIATLESGFFSGGQPPSLDLAAVARKWLKAALGHV